MKNQSAIDIWYIRKSDSQWRAIWTGLFAFYVGFPALLLVEKGSSIAKYFLGAAIYAAFLAVQSAYVSYQAGRIERGLKDG